MIFFSNDRIFTFDRDVYKHVHFSQIIHCFSSEQQTSRLSDDCCVDIDILEKAENFYHIHVTNYNRRNVYLQNNSTPFQTICSKFLSLIASEPMTMKNYLRPRLFATKEGENEIPRIYNFPFVDDSSYSISNEEISDYLVQKKNCLFTTLEVSIFQTVV